MRGRKDETSLQINIMQNHAKVSPSLTFPCCHDDKMATYKRKLPQVCTSHGNATSMQHHKMSIVRIPWYQRSIINYYDCALRLVHTTHYCVMKYCSYAVTRHHLVLQSQIYMHFAVSHLKRLRVLAAAAFLASVVECPCSASTSEAVATASSRR